MRQSLTCDDGLFNVESSAAQRLRLTVYGRVVGLLAICFAKEFLPPTCISSKDLCEQKLVQQKLRKQMSREIYIKKDRLRYIAKFTHEGLSFISTLANDKSECASLAKALQDYKQALCIARNKPPPDSKDKDGLLKKIVQYRWFYAHLILCCLEHEVRRSSIRKIHVYSLCLKQFGPQKHQRC